MAQKICKHCRRKVSGSHYCSNVDRNVPFDNSDDFLSTYATMSILSGSDNGSAGGSCGGSDSGGSDSGGGCDGGGGGD